jgi:hypothetical protein
MKDTSAATPAAEARRRIEIVKMSEGKIKIILSPPSNGSFTIIKTYGSGTCENKTSLTRA